MANPRGKGRRDTAALYVLLGAAEMARLRGQASIEGVTLRDVVQRALEVYYRSLDR